MPAMAVMAGGALLSGAMGARAASGAARAQAQGFANGNAALTQGRDNANGQLIPYAEGGGRAFSAQQALLGLGGDSASQMAALQNSPGYQFRLNQGLQGVQNSAGVAGLLGSGRTLKALNNYGSDYASNEYDKRFNQLNGVAQMGYNASNQIGSNYMNTAQSLNGNATGAGDARAQGIMGRAQAWQGAIKGVAGAIGGRG